MNFKEWLVLEAKEKILAYHGTSDRHLPAILSQGLIPEPKEKTWQVDPNASFTNPSRATVGGIYITKNLMTASSSALNAIMDRKGGYEAFHTGKEIPLIVIMEIQPETVMADEDDVTYTARQMPSPYPNTVGAHTHEYSAMQLYEDYLTGHPNFKKWQDEYVDSNLQYFARDANPGLRKRLAQVFADGFVVTLKRAVSYLASDYYTSRLSDVVRKAGLPDKTQSEHEYRDYMDRLSRLLKGRALESFISTGRIMTPIRYSGANKIIGIVRLRSKPNYSLEKVYGTLPPQFMEDYRQKIGEVRWYSPKENS